MYDEIVNRYYNVILNYCKYKLNGNNAGSVFCSVQKTESP